MRKLTGTLFLTRPDAASLSVTALDLNGIKLHRHSAADEIKLAPDRIYYLIEPNPAQ